MASYTFALAGSSPVEITKGCGLDQILACLVGDSIPERVKEVMEWCYKPSSAVTQLYRENVNYSGKRVVVFGVFDYDVYIVAGINIRRPARGVNAEAKFFSPSEMKVNKK